MGRPFWAAEGLPARLRQLHPKALPTRQKPPSLCIRLGAERSPPALFHADARRIVAMGSSAGGYLTLTAGFRVKLISIPGAEHGLSSGDPKLIGQAYQTALQFVQHHTGE